MIGNYCFVYLKWDKIIKIYSMRNLLEWLIIIFLLVYFKFDFDINIRILDFKYVNWIFWVWVNIIKKKMVDLGDIFGSGVESDEGLLNKCYENLFIVFVC